MRLYLSSFRFGNRPEELTKFAGKGTKTGVIANARDFQEPARRAMRCAEEIEKLQELGFEADELDLRDYFGNKEKLKVKLQNYDMVWVSGGNVFVLRAAMAQCGADEILSSRIKDNSLIYSGYSAAGCLLSSTLEQLVFVDDPALVEQVYGTTLQKDGLGILDYVFVPHYKSDHPESAQINEVVKRLDATKQSYLALSDGEVLIIDGDGSSEKVVS